MIKKKYLFVLVVSLLISPSLSLAKTNYDYLNTGLTYLQKSDLNNAEINFKKALDLDPSNDKLYFYLGKIYLSEFELINSPENNLNNSIIKLEKADNMFRESYNNGLGYIDSLKYIEKIDNIRKKLDLKVLSQDERKKISLSLIEKNLRFMEIWLNNTKEKSNIKNFDNLSLKDKEKITNYLIQKKISLINIDDYKIIVDNFRQAYKIDVNVKNRVYLIMALSNYYSYLLNEPNFNSNEANNIKSEIKKLHGRNKIETINLNF